MAGGLGGGQTFSSRRKLFLSKTGMRSGSGLWREIEREPCERRDEGERKVAVRIAVVRGGAVAVSSKRTWLRERERVRGSREEDGGRRT